MSNNQKNGTIKMNNERLTTMETFNKTNPFTVPEGYFESLTQRVMDNIDLQEQTNVVALKPTKHSYWKVWVSGIAACAAGTLLCINIFDKEQPDIKHTALLNEQTEEAYNYDRYQMEVMNYAMVDYNDVYNYLSGNE